MASGSRTWTCNILFWCAYYHGNGVERDEKKAARYYELAAIGGHVTSRHNLGCFDYGKQAIQIGH